MDIDRRNLLGTPTGRRWLFGLLYANEGAPIGLIWLALPVLLRNESVSNERIGAVASALVLVWTFKFLWAPLVDRLRSVPGGLRFTIATMQLGMAGTLAWAGAYNLGDDLEMIGWILLVHAFFAATQDVSIDALAIHVTPPPERGRLNASMQTGMILGRSVVGGSATFASVWLDWKTICLGVACLQLVTLTLVLTSKETTSQGTGETHAWADWSKAVLHATRRWTTWLGLAFALLAGAAFETAGFYAGPMLKDMQLSEAVIAAAIGVGFPLTVLTGSVLGGWLADRTGHVIAAMVGLVGFATSVLVLAAMLWNQPNVAVLFVSLGAMYLFFGAFTVSSYAVFMDLTEPALGATQFSAFMAATNGCEAWSARMGGYLATRYGYAPSFAVASLVSLCTLPLLIAIRQLTRNRNRESVAAT